MTGRRTLAIIVSAALTASLVSVMTGSDVEAAKTKSMVRCDGEVATKVGTPGNDRILHETGVLFAEIADAGPPGDGTDDLFVKESASDPDPVHRIEMSQPQTPAVDDFFIDVEFYD